MSPGRPPNHYAALGVRPGAGRDEIRRAHRQLARVLHPDRHLDATDAERRLAERRMREVNEAWAVLSDPQRRRAHDAELRARVATAGGAGSATGAPGADPSGARGRAGRPEDDDDPDQAFRRARLAEVDPDEPELSPGHLWLLRRGPVVVALVVAVVLFVVTAYAGGGGADRAGDVAPTSAAASDCVRVTEGRTAVRVGCSGAHDGRIVTAVDRALECPPGTSYVVLDGSFLCVTTDEALRANVTPTGGG
jgi:hypothetical protein